MRRSLPAMLLSLSLLLAPLVPGMASGAPGATLPDTADAKPSRAPDDRLAHAQALIDAEDWPRLKAWGLALSGAEPDNALSWYALAHATVFLDQHDEARSALREVVRLIPSSANSWRQLGSVNLRLRRYYEARDAYREAVRLDPKDALTWEGLGRANGALNRYEEARDALRESVRLDPESPTAWDLLGSANIVLKRWGEARAAAEELRRLDPALASDLRSLIDRVSP